MNVLRVAFSPTKNRRVNELVGLLLLVASLLLLLSLLSYTPTDPSLNTAGGYLTGRPAHNWAGLLGAGISDLLLQSEGVASFLLPLLLGGLGWVWMRSRPAMSPGSKLSGAFLWLLFAPALFGLLPLHGLSIHGVALEGLVGRFMADGLLHYLNYPGACILALALVAAAIYLTTTFSLDNARNWWAVHFAFVMAWRDRWHNWKTTRAERRQAKATARQQAQMRKADVRRMSKKTPAADEEVDDTITPITYAAGSGRVRKLPDIWETPTASAVARHGKDAGRERENSAPGSFDFAEEPVREAKAAPSAKPVAMTAAAAERAAAIADDLTIGTRADASIKPVTVTPKNVHGFRLPPSSLLHRSDDHQIIREDVLREEATTLVEKYAEFDVNGQIVQINPGPVVTTFEFRPDAGVKYSRVTGLSDDLCLAMRAESILIERMAGKSTVGIQVPNANRETIWLRDVVESDNFGNSKSKLTLAMGKDINGRIVHADLATMPHVLIAGSTGSGKSVAINAMIMSILYKATPEQVRMILVDPKRVELGMYEGVPHLFTPIITEPKLAANALRNAVREMERRLKLLASRSVRNIDQYNKLFENKTPSLFDENSGEEEKPLPFIVIIIDELADLMMLDKANVEEAITRLAQMARAVGIHLVLATQRPSVDVITGLIKANVPTRISFRLATKVDSRTILDANGAESLLGRGDMLFLPPGTSRLQRVHAPFVTEKEIAAVVDFWKSQGSAEYQQGFLESPRDEKGRELDGDPEGEGEQDAMFEDAVRLVLEFGKASTSLLQRRLRIGYGRAAHLIDMMERDGIVGPADGSRPREILKSPDWLQEVEQSLR
ncbi:MAG TPA: DNA translocase FtsK [Acidobacteriaceae bacterium]|jgi:S-DNA-T family DNA segregation ATPase FtsK/SpoIIIE|nr:DNA translocase FtsK [Acidobacteriaceae bacterium]